MTEAAVAEESAAAPESPPPPPPRERGLHDVVVTGMNGAWPKMRMGIATTFEVVWLATIVADWFWRQDTDVLPGWWMALGVVVLGYLLGIDLIAWFWRRR